MSKAHRCNYTAGYRLHEQVADGTIVRCPKCGRLGASRAKRPSGVMPALVIVTHSGSDESGFHLSLDSCFLRADDAAPAREVRS